jgi:hypothetical protein
MQTSACLVGGLHAAEQTLGCVLSRTIPFALIRWQVQRVEQRERDAQKHLFMCRLLLSEATHPKYIQPTNVTHKSAFRLTVLSLSPLAPKHTAESIYPTRER